MASTDKLILPNPQTKSSGRLTHLQTPSLKEKTPLVNITAIAKPKDDTLLSKVDESPIILHLEQALRAADGTVVQIGKYVFMVMIVV